MAGKHRDRLNRTLSEWLDRTADTGNREALVDRISRAVEELPPQPHRGRERVWRRRRASRAIFAMAAVAIALLVALVWQIQNLAEPTPPTRVNDPVEELLAQLDVEELERRMALLDQLDELFEDRWEWMVECGDRVDMRVAKTSQTVLSPELVAARLAVLVRDDPGEPFRVQEKTFVLTREQQAVEAVLEDGASRTLYFWAFPVDDELFTYDVDLQTKKPHRLSISSSGLVASGKPTKILSFEQDASEYRVYLLLVPQREKTSLSETRQL